MAKINVSSIEGYAEMTVEQKLAALEAYEMSDPDYSGYVKKEAFDKTASELAEIKRKHNALLSEDERNKQATEEELTTLRAKVEAMEKEKLVANHKAEFLAMGYDESLAEASAKALVDGDTAKVFANQKEFLKAHDKYIKAEILGNTPKPPAGEGGKSKEMTLEKFRKLSPQERHDFSVNHPEEYKELYNGGNQ